MTQTVEVVDGASRSPTEIQNVFELGHLACLIDGMDLSGAKERWNMHPRLKSRLKTFGAYTVHLSGLPVRQLYARHYLEPDDQLIGAGYEAIVLGSSRDDEVRKYFCAPYRYTGGRAATEHAGILEEDLNLLGKYMPSATIPARNGVDNLPFKGFREHLTSYSEQQRVTRVVGCLRELLRRPEWAYRREPAIQKGLNEIVEGSMAMFDQERAIPDVIGLDNTLVYDDGHSLRIAQVDASLFRKSQFRYEHLIEDQQVKALGVIEELRTYL